MFISPDDEFLETLDEIGFSDETQLLSGPGRITNSILDERRLLSVELDADVLAS